MSKITNDGLTRSGTTQDAIKLYPYGNIVCQRVSVLLLLLVWQAPLGVRSAKRRHQSPEWTILSHSYRLIQ